MKSTNTKIAIKVASVKQQGGSADCGIYSLAFTQFIVMNKEAPPVNITFGQQLDKLEPIPMTTGNARYYPQKTLHIDVYCEC